jgi:hypothetical protein
MCRAHDSIRQSSIGRLAASASRCAEPHPHASAPACATCFAAQPCLPGDIQRRTVPCALSCLAAARTTIVPRFRFHGWGQNHTQICAALRQNLHRRQRARRPHPSFNLIARILRRTSPLPPRQPTPPPFCAARGGPRPGGSPGRSHVPAAQATTARRDRHSDLRRSPSRTAQAPVRPGRRSTSVPG